MTEQNTNPSLGELIARRLMETKLKEESKELTEESIALRLKAQEADNELQNDIRDAILVIKAAKRRRSAIEIAEAYADATGEYQPLRNALSGSYPSIFNIDVPASFVQTWRSERGTEDTITL